MQVVLHASCAVSKGSFTFSSSAAARRLAEGGIDVAFGIHWRPRWQAEHATERHPHSSSEDPAMLLKTDGAGASPWHHAADGHWGEEWFIPLVVYSNFRDLHPPPTIGCQLDVTLLLRSKGT